MGASIPPAWTTGTAPNSFAAYPAGRLGTFGGQLMRVGNRAQQHEIARLLGPLSGMDVLEVGHGPGVLLGLLARTARHVIGVDPSMEMRRLAIRAHAGPLAAGRLEVRPGDAGATGLPDAAVDLVVSVNNVAIWPDLEAGVAELRRVLRPGGRLVLSWHGGERPARMARGFVLSEDRLRRISDALRARFPEVHRTLTRRCTVFDARTTPSESPISAGVRPA
jgi:SAM-dependent methyltransferase